MKIEFNVRPGFHCYSKRDAQVIGPALVKCRTKDRLVEYATPVSCPVHRYFTWNNRKAGHWWRIQEAGKMFQCITIPRIGGKPLAQGEGERLFHSVPVIMKEVNKEKNTIVRRYYTMPEIAASRSLTDALLSEARFELLKWKRKYTTYLRLLKSAQFRRSMELVNEALKLL